MSTTDNNERIININAAATKQGLEGHEERIVELETQVATMKNLVQTLINQMTQLQQANNLALAQLRGHGSTDNGVNS